MSPAPTKRARIDHARQSGLRAVLKQADPSVVESAPAEQDVSHLAARIAGSREQLRHAIAEAAYYRAQGRGFVPGHELEDWLFAQGEILGK